MFWSIDSVFCRFSGLPLDVGPKAEWLLTVRTRVTPYLRDNFMAWRFRDAFLSPGADLMLRDVSTGRETDLAKSVFAPFRK